MESVDKDGNNLLHITAGCFFSDNFLIKEHTRGKTFDHVKDLFKRLLTQKNYNHVSPLENLIKTDPPIKRMQRLVKFELIGKGSFDGLEDQLIRYVCLQTINLRGQDKKLFEKKNK